MNDEITRKSDSAWNPPVQKRSIERVESIIEAARELVLKSDSMDIKITEVAKRAKVPIGSVYQFFPNQSALLSRLFEIEMSNVDVLFHRGMSEVNDLNQAIDQVEELMRSTLNVVKERPLLFLIWTGATANATIRKADFINTRKNAQLLTQRLVKLTGSDTNLKNHYYPTALLICHMWGAVVQLCIELEDPDEQTKTMDRYIEIVRSHLAKLLF